MQWGVKEGTRMRDEVGAGDTEMHKEARDAGWNVSETWMGNSLESLSADPIKSDSIRKAPHHVLKFHTPRHPSPGPHQHLWSSAGGLKLQPEGNVEDSGASNTLSLGTLWLSAFPGNLGHWVLTSVFLHHRHTQGCRSLPCRNLWKPM